MGYGGSVQAMIDSLKNNARQRPSIRRGFDRERYERLQRVSRVRKWRKLTDEDRKKLHHEISIQKNYNWKKHMAALLTTLAIVTLVLWLFFAHLLPIILKDKQQMDNYRNRNLGI